MELAVEKAQKIQASGKTDDQTLIGSLLQQKLPSEETKSPRLAQEVTGIIGAGGETVSRTLALASFHIIDQPAVRDRLIEELNTAIPDVTSMPDWQALTALPYLSACVEEAVRLAYGMWLVGIVPIASLTCEQGCPRKGAERTTVAI